MKNLYPFILKTIIVFICLCLVNYSFSQNFTVSTQRYDNSRLGWNSKETILNVNNVNANSFGLVFTRAVDDLIYAQPLVVSNLSINGAIHNVVFVATVNNSVYAFDADNPASTNPFWNVNLTPSGTRVISNTDLNGAGVCSGNYKDFIGNIGIVGTPVIDTLSFTMYVVSRDLRLSSSNYEQYLHAMDIRTGAEKSGSPVLISASYNGNGDGSVNRKIQFNAMTQNQRPALTLYNGVVYVCWASHCDFDPYHGWIIGFDAGTLQKRIMYNDSPDGGEGGIWMSGTGPVINNGYMYVSTGNGTVGTNGVINNSRNLTESVLKLSLSGDTMKVADYFIPNNYQALISNDMDYGVDGIIILPNTTISLSGSKEGKIYVINSNRLGKYTPGNDSVLQYLYVNTQTGNPDTHVHGTPVYYRFTNQVDSEYVYAWAESDTIKQFLFKRSTGLFDLAKTKKGHSGLQVGMPGGILSVSSNGQLNGTGIVWASHPQSGDANHAIRPGTLEAFDARNVGRSLWSSDQVPGRDAVGQFAKFNTPVVANGKVYLGTFSNRLNVYGVIQSNASGLPSPWVNSNIGAVGASGGASYSANSFTITGSGADIWDNADGFDFVYRTLSGDGSIIARVVSQTNTNAWAKAGVMIRETLAAGATEASTVITPTPANDVNFLSRTATNGISTAITGAAVAVPYWVKIERTGTTFNSYSSADGNTWTKVGSAIINMGTSVYIGMCVTSHNDGVLSTVVFDNVTLSNVTAVAGNIALNKPATSSSVEKAGLEATKANDGDNTTRWSSAFSDPQWLEVDLQSNYTISQVVCIWEAAYALAYRMEVSNDNVNWTVAKSVTNGAGGTETWNLSGVSGRYIRLYGITRDTEYGYSLYEFQVFGTSVATNTPPVANAGANQSITLPANSVTLNGSSSNDPDGTITNFSWSQVSGPNTATLSNVNTSVANASNLIQGSYVFKLTVTDNGGLTATSNVTVTVNPGTPANIALNKPATASSVEAAGFEPNKANDGDLNTRWSSNFGNSEWIAIDLQATYTISQVVLIWESAFGLVYNIEVSSDGVNWTVAKAVTNGTGGTETWNLTGVSGRYIRMAGITRGTRYGYSLYEFKVFGSALKSVSPFNTKAGTVEITSAVVYPNPFSGVITIDLKGDTYQNAKILDAEGRLLDQWTIQPGITEVTKDLGYLHSGIYFLKLEGQQESEVIRIVKY